MPGLHLDTIINGLTTFTHAYAGKLWLEILLAQGINDAPEDIEALITAIHPMRVDRLQLNTVVRPPAKATALPVAQERLAAIASQLQQALNVPVDLPFAPATTPFSRTNRSQCLRQQERIHGTGHSGHSCHVTTAALYRR